MKLFVFTVEGRGPFPLDMLRYDCCWPRTGNDVSLVSNSVIVRGIEGRRIALVSTRKPTLDRWTSFGWNVLDCETRAA